MHINEKNSWISFSGFTLKKLKFFSLCHLDITSDLYLFILSQNKVLNSIVVKIEEKKTINYSVYSAAFSLSLKILFISLKEY